jgi:hypothetical protein
VDSAGSRKRPVAGSCECGDEPSGLAPRSYFVSHRYRISRSFSGSLCTHYTLHVCPYAPTMGATHRRMSVAATGNVDCQATMDAIWQEHLKSLVPCSLGCGRTFNPDRVAVHERGCKGPRK